MSSHRRVKDISYDEDDVYSDEDYDQDDGQEEYTAEDKQNFAELTPVVRAGLEEAGLQASDRQIEDALWHYYWDVAKSVDYLKAQHQPSSKAIQQSKQVSKQEKGKSKFDQALEKNITQPQGTAQQVTNGLSGKNTTSTTSTVPTPDAPKPVPNATLPDAHKLWSQARKSQRPFASFVVAGHVDHGKSTLMGRLLLDTGAVQQRDIDKFKKQAAEIGKESFALAWVMDTGSEERERGVTVDIAQHHFSTKTTDFTILDAPGHRDFVPNMIGGALMADTVLLVIDANQLESGLKGQTIEHVQLAFGVGIRSVVVAVNKLDAANPAWSQSLFQSVKERILHLLTEVGFADQEIKFVPCSGLSGENVVRPVAENSEAAEVCKDHPTLVSALESLAYNDDAAKNGSPTTRTPQEAAIQDSPFRLQVADVFRGGIQNPLSVSGRIISGSVVVGQKVIVQPGGDQATVKGIQVANDVKDYAVAFEIASLHLDGDLESLSRNLRTGDILTATTNQIKLIKAVSAKIHVLDTILPQTVELYFGRLHVASSIRRLVATVNAKGETLKKSPRSLKAGQVAKVEVAFPSAMPLEPGNRIILRAEGGTIAFGTVDGVFTQ